jgi:hypothetical protein
MGQDRWASWAPTDPQEVARWVRTRRRNWRYHVDRIGQDRWASRAPTDPHEDHLKDGERAVRQRQKRTDIDKQQDRVLEEKKKKIVTKNNLKSKETTVLYYEKRRGMCLLCLLFFRGVGMRVSPISTSDTNWPVLPAPDDRWVWSTS